MRQFADTDRRASQLLDFCVNYMRNQGLPDHKIAKVLFSLRHQCREVGDRMLPQSASPHERLPGPTRRP